MNTNFDKSLKHGLKQEGGWSDRKGDRGRATNYGVTIGTYESYKGRAVTKDELRSIRPEEVKEIYKTRYWDDMKGDEITDPDIATAVFDQIINKGARVKKHVQELLGLPVDGDFGPQTLEKLNSLNPEEKKEFLTKFIIKEKEDYDRIIREDPSQIVNKNIWMNRLNSLSKAVGLGPFNPDNISNPTVATNNTSPRESTKAIDYNDVGITKEDVEAMDELYNIASGDFRFNDIILKIPPESISITINEFENSIMMMRQDTPVQAQSGRKKVRIVVNFPIDLSTGFSEISQMLIQIKKSPIATIENEKIRKELFGNETGVENIGVVVDNITGYIQEDYPELLRCTLQMTWFNHAPYVESIQYIEVRNGKKVKQRIPSTQFKRFYMSKTSSANGVLINNPSTLKEKDSLVILYKEYQDFSAGVNGSAPVISMEKPSSSRSALDGRIKSISHANYQEIQRLNSIGWYLAEEDKDKFDDMISGIFYRWKRFEIPYSDLDTSGALLLQNVSFSLSTNPSYINMEMYSMPTIQFLGGSVADIRAVIFAAAEYSSKEEKRPIGTSDKLRDLMSVFKRVAADRMKYSKYSKENHMLISHPLAKLMKYRSHTSEDKHFMYYTSETNYETFVINDYLPVIASGTHSSTMPSLPFASSLQVDFKETRLAKHDKPIKYSGQSGSSNPFVVQKKIIETLYSRNKIKFNPLKVKFESDPRAANKGTPEYQAGLKMVKALNILMSSDDKKLKNDLIANQTKTKDKPNVSDMHMVYKSKYFNKSSIPIVLETRISDDKYKQALLDARGERGLQNAGLARLGTQNTSRIVEISSGIFNSEWISQFILKFYVDHLTAVNTGAPWAEAYIPLFDDYANVKEKGNKDLYPDMLLPDDVLTPAFFFADNAPRVKAYKENIVNKIPTVYSASAEAMSQKLLKADFAKTIDPALKTGVSSYAPLANNAVYKESRDGGIGRIQSANDPAYRSMGAQQTAADMSPPVHSLNQAFPTFQVQLYSEKLSFFQAFSAEDMQTKELFDERQRDLLDIYDLSSIIDIRIIKDEYEAADVMIIRVLGTHKTLMTKQAKDPSYIPERFSMMGQAPEYEYDDKKKDIDGNPEIKKDAKGNFVHKKDPKTGEDITKKSGLIAGILQGVSSVNSTYNTNLEDIGLKEGTKIRAFLGNSNDIEDLSLEFTGKIASINGKDIIEIYCIGDGHELIQTTFGFPGDKDREYVKSSDTTKLLAELLADADEIKSFGNTKFKIIGDIGLNVSLLYGGRSSLDNIYAPQLHPPTGGWGQFSTAAVKNSISAAVTFGSLVVPMLGFGALFGPIGLYVVGAGILYGVTKEALDILGQRLYPASFTVYQQTIWDVLQELTLRHPGCITATVPFDNRSSIYFGEPDGIYFYRGAETALEKALKVKASVALINQDERQDFNFFSDQFRNPTTREIYDAKSKLLDLTEVDSIGDSTMAFANTDSRTRIRTRELQKKQIDSLDLETVAMLAMQKTYRSYHLITSEHDIISNDMQASSMDVANSVQVYHPKEADDIDFSGTKWFSSYALTDRMKADDDLTSNTINNKVFTFHNAHRDHPRLDLPERYAKAVLCKELENIYRGKISVLGRKAIKPHDIVVLRDTHNKINGPVGVKRIVQTISPATGWTTTIYPKFIAIPDNSSGPFQMKAILKACRYWLSTEYELFYSSMEKFMPSENTRSNGSDEDLQRALEQVTDAKFMSERDLLEDDNGASKEAIIEQGEISWLTEGTPFYQSIPNKMYNDTKKGSGGGKDAAEALAVSTATGVGNYVLAPLLTKGSLIPPREILADGTLGAFKSIGARNYDSFTKTAVKGFDGIKSGVKAAKGIGPTTMAAGSGLLTGTVISSKLLLGTVGGIFGGLALDYLLESAIDGFVNFMKYRQPISIFPLTKEGKPWLAALNGFKENTVIEHLELQATRAADRLGMTSLLAQRLLNAWVGDAPIEGNTEEALVVDVIDGDTLILDNGDRVTAPIFRTSTGEDIRLYGVDTGEKSAPRGSAEAKMAGKATKFLKEKIFPKGGIVTIIRYEKDRYGRRVAAVSVDGLDLSKVIIDNKLGFFYAGSPKSVGESDWQDLLNQHNRMNNVKE